MACSVLAFQSVTMSAEARNPSELMAASASRSLCDVFIGVVWCGLVLIIVIQKTGPRGLKPAGIGHKKIEQPVVVKICPGAPARVAPVGYNAARQNFGKGAVGVVSIEEVMAPGWSF